MARTSDVLLFLLVSAVQGEDYCRFGGDHTMCRYKGVGLKCSPRLSGGVSQTAQTAILNAHNAFRQRVAQGQETRGAPGPQPPAANMLMMEWSSELAMVAQRWADQCDFKMDVCRSVSQFPSVAQSIYQLSSPTTGTPPSPDWSTVITRWYDHVADFDRDWVLPYVSNSAWYYSQIVWAETYKVGCGYTMYKNSHDPQCINQFYVCNYAAAGNMERGTTYKIGRACSQCPDGTSCRCRQYPALCV